MIHVLLTRAPLYSEDCSPFLARLACVKRAASVDSEPGSNSRLIWFLSPLRQTPPLCVPAGTASSAERLTSTLASGLGLSKKSDVRFTSFVLRLCVPPVVSNISAAFFLDPYKKREKHSPASNAVLNDADLQHLSRKLRDF